MRTYYVRLCRTCLRACFSSSCKKMGCSESKAAKVSEKEITIQKRAPKRSREHDRQTVGSHQEEEMEIEEEREEVGEGDAAGMGAVYSGQSELERAVMAAATSHSTATPSFSSAVATSPKDPQTSRQPVSASISAPMMFEVCMSSDDRMEAKAPPPSWVKKQESSPAVISERLEKKQAQVAERKKEELEKRLSKSRLSKKDRLRKEIMTARGMQNESGGDAKVRLSFGTILQEDPSATEDRAGRRLQPVDRLGGSYDTAAHMEGDRAYNTEEDGEFWSSSGGHWRSSSRGDTSSTNNLEL